MAGTLEPGRGDLDAPSEKRPHWRRGNWPLWLAPIMWVLLFVREVPGLIQAMLQEGPARVSGSGAFLGIALLLIAALGVAAMAPGRLSAQHLGLTRIAPRDLLVWTVLSLAGLYGVVWLGSIVSGTPNQDTNFGMGRDVASDVLLVLAIGSLGPVAEEFAYRATLFRACADGTSRWVAPRISAALAVGLSSLAFMLAHTGAPPWHQTAYFVFGAVLATGYWWTGSLYVALVPHLLNNSYAATSMAIKADAGPLVITVAVLGPLPGLAVAYGVGKALSRPRAFPR